MAASLVVRQLTVSRGPQVLVSDADLSLVPGGRLGLVGRNGVGKSTFLQVLAGQHDPERGSVERSPATATVGLLAQEPERSAETVREFVRRRTGVAAVDADLAEATSALAAGSKGAEDEYSRVLERWLALGASDLDARLPEVAADLGINARLLDQSTATLSGGEAARCSLMSVVLSRFDVVLLDEPTNDLDADGLRILEDWLLRRDSAVALVSHDRRFLERTVTDVAEIDEFTHEVTVYGGGWGSFVAERERARRHAQERYDAFATRRADLLRRAQREREWAAQGRARVRRSDEPDKNIRAFKLDQTEQLAGRAARTERAIERLEEVDEPRRPWQLRLQIPDRARSGDVVAELHDVTLRRPSFTLGPISLSIAFGDRIALTGANGSGKTTLIDLIVGRAAPDSGDVMSGSSVVVGEVEQARSTFTGSATLLRTMADVTGWTDVEVRSLLAKFGLSAEHVGRTTGSLSPGERTRAGLAALMAVGANFLILDEPTNHLDIEAIEQLEAALETFRGTVLLVTHDQALLDNVRVDRRWELVEGRLTTDA